jgi:DNA end-binding protein Ku
MAPRPAWKGYLKLSLVTCAVELSNATTNADKVSFRTLNRGTGHGVKRQYVDSVTGKPLDKEDEVKGYEVEDGEFILIEEEEIEAVQIESSHTLNLDRFVEKAKIDQIYLDNPYYVTPADKVSEEAFAVIRAAMEKKKMAGLARIVLYRRERPCVIEPFDNGMLLTTLRYDSTVRQPETVFEDIPDVPLDKDMLDLASDLVEKKKRKFDPSRFVNKYETALMAMVEAKQKGRKPPKAKPEPKESNVVNLFEALKKSLAAEPKPEAAEKSGSKAKTPAAKSTKKAAPAKKKSA